MSSIAGLMLIMLGISYYTARWIILEDAEVHRDREVEFYARNLEKLHIDLAQYAKTIRDDLRVQEYVFAVVRIGAKGDAVATLVNEQFQGLPYDQLIILGDNGQVLMGSGHEALVDMVRVVSQDEQPQITYLYHDGNFVLTAMMPIQYRSETIGLIATTRVLDSNWLNMQSRNPGAHLLLTQGNSIVASTHTPLIGEPIRPDDGIIDIEDEAWRLAEVRVPAKAGESLRFWLADSEAALVENLAQFNRIMVILVLVSVALILVSALVAVNSFSRPINRLIALTRGIADGHLPAIRKTGVGTEIDALLNQFADLTDALMKKDIEVKLAHRELRQSAITDALTQLYNRRYLDEVYPKLLAQTDRDHCYLTAILCDLDHFKQINDSYGHPAGDYCLVEFSKILNQHCRANDYIFRIGGEEFLILSLNKNHTDGIHTADKICDITKTYPLFFEGIILTLTVSCGVSSVRLGANYKPTQSRLVCLADHALYQAKDAGRNCVRYNSDDAVSAPTNSSSISAR